MNTKTVLAPTFLTFAVGFGASAQAELQIHYRSSSVDAQAVEVDNTTCETIVESDSQATDGVYVINPTGSDPFEAYCDMSNDGGGWTLVARAYGGDRYSEWALSPAALNVSSSPSPTQSETFRYSDETINAIRATSDGIYRLNKDGIFDSDQPTRFWTSAPLDSDNESNNIHCSYEDVNLSSDAECYDYMYGDSYATRNGLADFWRPNRDEYDRNLVFSQNDIGWVVGDGQVSDGSYGGRCDGQEVNCNFTLYVR